MIFIVYRTTYLQHTFIDHSTTGDTLLYDGIVEHDKHIAMRMRYLEEMCLYN